MSLKKEAVERAEKHTKKAQEETKELGAKSAAMWRLHNPLARSRGRKWDIIGTERFVAYARLFKYAASLALETAEPLMNGLLGEARGRH